MGTGLPRYLYNEIGFSMSGRPLNCLVEVAIYLLANAIETPLISLELADLHFEVHFVLPPTLTHNRQSRA